MSYLETLLAEKTSLDAKIASATTAVRQAGIDAVRALLVQHCLTAADVFGGAAKVRNLASVKAPAEPMYRDPFNHAQTWAGRGKRPFWLAIRLSSGATLDQFKIAA